MQSWVTELQKYTPKDTPIVIAGNKNDLVNKTVSLEEAQAYAKEIGVTHMRTSALSGDRVEEIFVTLTKKMVEQQGDAPEESSVRLGDEVKLDIKLPQQ